MRRTLLLVHRWTGLTLGLLLLFMALTGLAIVFREQLAPLVAPAPALLPGCDRPLPLDQQIAAARAAQPGVALESVLLRSGRGEPSRLRFTNSEQVSVDPCSASVVHQQPRWGGLFGRLEQLHRFRFLEDKAVSKVITGSAALVLAVVMVLGGLVLWWPSRQALRASATLRPGLKGRAFNLNLHRVTGLYASLVLLAVTITALPMAFKWALSAVYIATGSSEPAPRPESAPPAPHAVPMNVGALWERGQGVFNHPSLVVISPGRGRTDAVEVYALERGAAHPQAISYAYFDAYTGALLRSDPYATSSLGNRIYLSAAAIHGGEFGLLLQWLQFIGVLAVPVLAWTGVASFLRGRRKQPAGLKFKVRAIRDEALGVKSFELVRADGRRLPTFGAGAHIGVRIDERIVRQYSLCNDPAERGRYLIAVKRSNESRGGSTALHDRVQEGDVLMIEGPRNNFPLDPDATHHLLMAAGIGITPLLSMALQLQRLGGSFELHYFARSPEHVVFRDLLQQARFDGKVHVHYSMGSERMQQLLASMLAKHPPGHHLYLCGSRRFMDAVREAAAASWRAGSIHVEHFGADPDLLDGPREPFEVHLARSGRTLAVPVEKSIVDVLSDAGVQVSASCLEGVCGSCVTRVIEGRCDHRDAFLSPAEHAAGERIIICVSRASGRLVLDL